MLPFYAEEYGASGTQLGLIVAAYALAQYLCAPLWGRLSDRVGRRRVILLTVAGTACALLLLGLADSLAWIFVARILGGSFGANIGVASAYIADVTDESERTRWMGMLGASFGIGFVLGPAIGGLLAPYGNGVPMLAAAGLAALNLVHASFRLEDPPHRAGDAAAGGAAPLSRRELLRDVRVRRLCVANFTFSFAVTQLETVFAYLMLHRFAYQARDIAPILVMMAVVMGGIQGGGMRALAARFPERGMVCVGSLVLSGALILVPFSSSVAWMLVPLVIAAAGRAVVQPSLLSMVSLAATPGSRGAVMGTFQAAGSLSRVFGPAVAGVVYDVWAAGPFVLASVLLVGVASFWRSLPARVKGPGLDESADSGPQPLGDDALKSGG